jgi:hypothetical protein
MHPGTLMLYLVGNRHAILTLAASRWTLALGAIFVLSAALARDYDQEDLLHEPWHLLVPFGASLLSSLVLFGLACVAPRQKVETWPGRLGAYFSFLGLFWMTAPLAWLYAIPYERFLTPLDAVNANLHTLGVVAAWRVALMVRVLMVLLNYGLSDALAVVLVFANGMAFLAMVFSPVPVIEVMSGSRLSEGENALRQAAQGVFCIGVVSAPFLLLWATAVITSNQPIWRWQPLETARRPGLLFWALALGSVALWALVLPSTQAEQQLRWRVEQDFKQPQRIAVALAEMSAHTPEDFPPHWQVPPRSMSPYGREQLMAIWEIILVQPPAPWVRQIYLDKLRDLLRSRMTSAELHQLGELLVKVPEGNTLFDELQREQHHYADAEELRVHFLRQKKLPAQNSP